MFSVSFLHLVTMSLIGLGSRYADKYECPQIFCFDGEVLLMLQFRAKEKGDIKKADCQVDCWVIPREHTGDLTLRSALYRLLLQGVRRCQGATATSAAPGGVRPLYREFFSGLPVWKASGGGFAYEHPGGWDRVLDVNTGAFYWTKDGSPTSLVWDTRYFWTRQETGEDENQNQEDEEDLYNA